jgi:hypothetical protein
MTKPLTFATRAEAQRFIRKFLTTAHEVYKLGRRYAIRIKE